MGMTDAQRAAFDAQLVPINKPIPAAKERGHARGQTDDRRIQDKGLRGIPCVGSGPGAIDGTRPGHGSVADLEQAARDIRIANETLAKAKAEALRAVRSNLRRKETT